MSLDDLLYSRQDDTLTRIDTSLIKLSGSIAQYIPSSSSIQIQSMNMFSTAALVSSLNEGGLIGGVMMIDSFMDMLSPSLTTPLIEEEIYGMHGLPRWLGKAGRFLAVGAVGYFCSKTLGAFAVEDIKSSTQCMIASFGALTHTYALYLSKYR